MFVNESSMIETQTKPFSSTLSNTEITYIRDSIEKMNKFHQIKILAILMKNKLRHLLTENKYGIHVNLSEISTICSSTLNELYLYIHYVQTQEKNLQKDEQQKEEIKIKYFQQHSELD